MGWWVQRMQRVQNTNLRWNDKSNEFAQFWKLTIVACWFLWISGPRVQVPGGAPQQNPNFFPIGEGFGFFVFFGKQNESIASPEKWSAGVCRPDSQWWPGGILEKCNREPQARNLNECWTVPFLSWCCPAFFWRWLTNFNGIFILLQFSLRLFYLFHANLYAHG